MCLASSVVGVSHRHLSDHLSELVENTLTDLEQSKVRRNYVFSCSSLFYYVTANCLCRSTPQIGGWLKKKI